MNGIKLKEYRVGGLVITIARRTKWSRFKSWVLATKALAAVARDRLDR